MRFKGRIYETEHPGDDIREAILTRTRVAIDYVDDEGVLFHVAARSEDGGQTYFGKWGVGDLNENCEISLRRYSGKNGQVVLFGKWVDHEYGGEGFSTFRLVRE